MNRTNYHLMRRMPWPVQDEAVAATLLTSEWLVTNGLGGYASGTIVGVSTRRYHGLLVAALPNPYGRIMICNHLAEQVRLKNGTIHRLGAEEHEGRVDLAGAEQLIEFRLEWGLPVWT